MSSTTSADIEKPTMSSGTHLDLPERIPRWRMVFDKARITRAVYDEKYEGEGTDESPYIVTWIENDPGNPYTWPNGFRWWICAINAFVTLAVAINSSAFSGSIRELLADFMTSTELITAGVSLFVLGFAVGPLLWAPLSEVYGRQIVFAVTYGGFTAFNIGAANAQSIGQLLVMRFFAGSFGSSPFTNSGGAIADVFMANERGLAMAFFALCPSLGPALGPVIGGFLSETEGWRWVQGLMSIMSGVLWIVGMVGNPETYAPVLLHARAAKLSKLTGKVYKTRQDITNADVGIVQIFKTSLSRPILLLFTEPIVLLLSLYMAIIYGTLYLFFGAYPIVYQQSRGWSEGIGGLPFLGIGVGMMSAIAYIIIAPKFSKKPPNPFPEPEERLKVCLIGAFALPIGIFWFAWTNYPSVHWMASVAAGVPFGFGMVFVFLSITNYLVDAYTIYAASALAANSVLRSLFGAAFPLFTKQMYAKLGLHWASSIPAFLALACIPFPFLFYHYGARIRRKCKYAAEAAAFRDKLVQKVAVTAEGEKEIKESEVPEIEAEGGLTLTRTKTYDASPYDLDLVNTRDSALTHKSQKSRKSKK
ncbi:hypothetical protein AAFC00_000676 [Neodothiora populina]|uniref:Major facilitator superfamily (MFS) profile domain-containing protein n=1 Tax=Neodothiora populina TaxID=2781224 RepID=A0ABR3PDU9_9PEZI